MMSFIGQHFVALVIIWVTIFSVVLMGVTIVENLRERRSAARRGSADQTSRAPTSAVSR